MDNSLWQNEPKEESPWAILFVIVSAITVAITIGVVVSRFVQ